MQVKIDTIVIKKRIRQDLGDLGSLMDSLRVHGQLNPIIINRKSELIAGHRRLESAKRLGWKSINVVILDREDEEKELELELEENVQRKELTADEVTEALSRLEKIRNPPFFKRIWQAIKDFLARLFRRG